MNQSEPREIYWDKVQGNPFLVLPTSAMLAEKGFIYSKTTKIKGESKKIAFPVNILYDKTYVHRFVIQKIFIPLGITKFNEAQKIIADAWNEYKKENKQ